MPDHILFSTTIQVRVSDINYGGHVGNDRYLTFAHEARVRFLAEMGFTELDVDGVGIILTDAVLQFKSEAFLGESLEISIGLNNFTKVGCQMYYRIQCGDRLVALVQTGIVFFQYDLKKIAAVPETFTSALESIKD